MVRGVEKWRLSPARNSSDGVQIFNLENYKYGYKTISKIQNPEAVNVYTSKYITKEFIDLNYTKKYWSSKCLEKPNIEYAELDEESLEFYIDKNKIVEQKLIEKDNYSTIYVKLKTSDNVYYVNFYILGKSRYFYISTSLSLIIMYACPCLSIKSKHSNNSISFINNSLRFLNKSLRLNLSGSEHSKRKELLNLDIISSKSF